MVPIFFSKSVNQQKGKQNMYKKGQILRRLYNGFLSDLYLDSEILIKTTNKIRTYMSAAMVLAGMYPPKDYQKWSDTETVWQPIPIYNNSPDQGTVCMQYAPILITLYLYLLTLILYFILQFFPQ